ncbi:MAG: 16S rRNA (cytosine(1402)-N(4))-methyltransferase [Candidatus Levybacteria bacterium CG10_big_fil_rev_8_21_14_0_10_35_13]|nr:MAG: 16S rRNA (cytosine(1402)-N(4))-methyltransferase [Candidatus Levybacteria bacterium CG10_big_fil_rev_8_21_14_0_10_35_13]
MNKFHTSVLLEEVISALDISAGKKYIDATVGGGGHAGEIIKRGGIVLGIDQDKEALEYVKKNFKFQISNFKLILVKGNFENVDKIANEKGFKKVSGILFDLGVSSHQIDDQNRGFSFLKEGPLDMRMDKNSSITAEYLVNLLGKGELYEIFNNYGEETHANALSRAIVSTRKVKAIRTTKELVGVIAKAYGIRGELSPFTKNKISQKAFQALRIAVNNELEAVEKALPKALGLLEKGGKLAVISFHSLEDRIVKKAFIKFEKENMGKIITKKPITAKYGEAEQNSRSKSAKLRVFEKN